MSPLAALETHPHAAAVLGAGLEGRPSHAYLLHGPAGTGKRDAARAFAAELLSRGAPDPEGSRARVMSGAHPDLLGAIQGDRGRNHALLQGFYGRCARSGVPNFVRTLRDFARVLARGGLRVDETRDCWIGRADWDRVVRPIVLCAV